MKFCLPSETNVKYKEFYKIFLGNGLKNGFLHFWIFVRICLYITGFRDLENISTYLFFNKITKFRATHTIFQIEFCFQEESFFMFIFTQRPYSKILSERVQLISNEKETLLKS